MFSEGTDRFSVNGNRAAVDGIMFYGETAASMLHNDLTLEEVEPVRTVGMFGVFAVLFVALVASFIISSWWIAGIFPLDAFPLFVKSFVLLVGFLIVAIRWVDVLFQD